MQFGQQRDERQQRTHDEMQSADVPTLGDEIALNVNLRIDSNTELADVLTLRSAVNHGPRKCDDHNSRLQFAQALDKYRRGFPGCVYAVHEFLIPMNAVSEYTFTFDSPRYTGARIRSTRLRLAQTVIPA